MIAEPTLEHYFYYLRRVEGDDAPAIQERRAVFERELEVLLAHLARLSGQTVPAWEWPEESQDRRASQRIVRTGWLDNRTTDRSCFVEARTYGDVYWFQVGYCQSGQEIAPQVFAHLRDKAWQPLTTPHLLGQSVYLCGIATGQVHELAARALAAYTGDAPGDLVSTHLAGSRATLYGSPERPHAAVLFYPNVEGEEWAGRVFLNDAAPRIELYRHKASRQLDWCEQNYSSLYDQEQSLRDLLRQINRTLRPDLALAQRFAQLYGVFNGNLSTLTERQVTIGVNLDNLDVVLADLEPLNEDHFLSATQEQLRRRQRQLETDLKYAGQTREQASAAVNALIATLGLERLVSAQEQANDTRSQAALIKGDEFPGVAAPVESEMETLASRARPSQPVTYPRVNAPGVALTALEKKLLQRLYHPGYEQVLVERGFSGGYGGARVLLTLPVTAGGLRTARKVTKIGSAPELRREQENYAQHVGDFLPFCAARVEKYYEQEERAALSYVFVGGGVLGEVLELEEYYRRHTAEQVTETLKVLLERELGQRWYSQTTPLNCFFADEYGRRLVEHLGLELRPASADALWPAGQPPAAVSAYQPILASVIPQEYRMFHADMLLSVEGLVVKQIKRDQVRLQDPGDQGAVVCVKFASQSQVPPGLELGSHVGVRGQVVYNRRGRMEQILREAFPKLPSDIGGESIQLPDVSGTYPNPLSIYHEILGRTLEGRQSYVHGDLHLRNVLVDQGGRGWLIDFAHVAKRHNLFDFIKLETYVRLMGLAGGEMTFSHDEYAQFEAALADASLQKTSGAPYPGHPQLAHAHDVILAIRRMAQNYVGPGSNLESEYIPALFLYCLARLKYHEEKSAPLTRLIFVTACVSSRYILGEVKEASEPAPTATGQRARTDVQRGAAALQKVQTPAWDPATLRQLLTAAFNDEGLTTLCFDHFRPVYDEFSAGMGKGQKIQRLLDYCERHAQLEKLLELVKRQNPAQYARFAS